jgi:hypothetical protein
MNRKNQLTAYCLCILFSCSLNPVEAQKSAKKPFISGVDPKNFDTDVVP